MDCLRYGLMEPHLDDGQMSVGTQLVINHTGATPPGVEVTVEVERVVEQLVQVVVDRPVQVLVDRPVEVPVDRIIERHDSREAMRLAVADTGSALVICAATTGAGFLAFVPTDFAGISDLGTAAVGGMISILILTLTLMPPLIGILMTQIFPSASDIQERFRIMAYQAIVERE